MHHVPSAELLRAMSSAWSLRATPQMRCSASRKSTYLSRLQPRNPNIGSLRSFATQPPLSARPTIRRNPYAPTHRDRGPASKEDTQTDFGKMDIFGNTEAPANAVDACTTDGFHLNNGIQTAGGSGILLFGGEAMNWRPWAQRSESKISDMLSKTGVLSIPKSGFGILELLYPKPSLLIIGTGDKLWMLDKESRNTLSDLGIKVDVMDTGNAVAAFNLLATERGIDEVGAALLPIGFKDHGR